MTINKLIKEIQDRIDYLEAKKDGLRVLEITRQEREKREMEIYEELDRLYRMKNC